MTLQELNETNKSTMDILFQIGDGRPYQKYTGVCTMINYGNKEIKQFYIDTKSNTIFVQLKEIIEESNGEKIK